MRLAAACGKRQGGGWGTCVYEGVTWEYYCGNGIVVYFDCDDGHTNLNM